MALGGVSARASIALLLIAVPPLLAAPSLPVLPPAVAAECEGDDCQAPPPPPEEAIPGTAIVNGPANPPVHFEGEGHAKGRNAGKKRGGHKRGHPHGAKRTTKRR